jgi:pimeloyl-ACP methyl ester carboxylesterase
VRQHESISPVNIGFCEGPRAREAVLKSAIFFHGWSGDPLGTWKQFPALVEQDPAYREFNVLVISYPTFFARRNLGVRAMARWLNDGLERNRAYERYQQIWMISHSMGGLIAREVLIANRLRRDNTAYRLLIEIATPHQGALVAPLARALGVSRGFLDDLTPGSPFLTNLRDDWNQLRDRPRTFCLTSPHDAVVTDESAIAQCDEYLRYPQWGHVDMIKPSDRRDDRYTVPMSRVLPKGA